MVRTLKKQNSNQVILRWQRTIDWIANLLYLIKTMMQHYYIRLAWCSTYLLLAKFGFKARITNAPITIQVILYCSCFFFLFLFLSKNLFLTGAVRRRIKNKKRDARWWWWASPCTYFTPCDFPVGSSFYKIPVSSVLVDCAVITNIWVKTVMRDIWRGTWIVSFIKKKKIKRNAKLYRAN